MDTGYRFSDKIIRPLYYYVDAFEMYAKVLMDSLPLELLNLQLTCET